MNLVSAIHNSDATPSKLPKRQQEKYIKQEKETAESERKIEYITENKWEYLNIIV
jgi:hypothetical protein